LTRGQKNNSREKMVKGDGSQKSVTQVGTNKVASERKEGTNVAKNLILPTN